MNKIIKYTVAALLALGLFGVAGQSVNAATGYQKLTHNAYAYNYNGQRVNNKLYRKGSKVKVIGSITLSGKKYNIIAGNIYIKAVNFKRAKTNINLGDGYKTSLLRNSYIYNSNGQRIKNKKLLKNHSVIYYGRPIKIKGKKYVLIGKNQYIRSVNVLLPYNESTSSNNTADNSSNKGSNITNDNSSVNSNASNSSQITNTSSSNNQSSNTTQDNSDNKSVNKVDLATKADYDALAKEIEKARLVTDDESSSFAKRKPFEDALDKADDYSVNRNNPNYPITSADIKKVISDLETAMANLDGKTENAKIPKIYIKDGNAEWTPALEKQVLDYVNEMNGSTNAHFISGTDNKKVGYTDGNGRVAVDSSEEYYHSIEINDDTGQPWKWQPYD